MFYSQFILAKKGPLGTIWIAAHLERKLRKNQVADTDIGVSVDSILFPEVPIALRLSSHLLLGVVRIYNRKVNYLFDDCSEALLKVKQAFRSTTVDLPPEESTAPYHSITLPETFDLDDFELPESELYQGNFVDHHVSSREQITLQDNMDNVAYPPSQFGLDERFGDGDTSQIGLDLEEEMLMVKASAPGQGGVIKTAAQELDGTVVKEEPGNLEDMDEDGNGDQINDLDEAPQLTADYAQAPATPGLVEVSNLSNAKERLTFDDHLESEDHHLTAVAAAEHGQDMSEKLDHHPGNKSSEDEPLSNDLKHDSLACMPHDNGYVDETLKVSSPSNTMSAEFTLVNGNGEEKVMVGTDDIKRTSGENVESPSCSNVTFDLEDPSRTNVLASEKCMENENKCASLEHPESHSDAKTTNNDEESYIPLKEATLNASSQLESPSRATVVDDETLAYQGLNKSTHEEVSSVGTCTLKPCNTLCNQQNTVAHESDDSLVLPNMQSDAPCQLSADNLRGENELNLLEAAMEEQGERCQSQMSDRDSCEKDQVPAGKPDARKSDERPDTAISGANQIENPDICGASELPPPERLLSVPELLLDRPNDLLVESTPDKEVPAGDDEIGTITEVVSGKKRSYTESTLTMESINSAESFGGKRSKRTAECIPDDDDLLSSILVGRRSSVLKMKSTPAFEVASKKRVRSVTRTSAIKRKVLLDDMMVLHGDAIRQQLTNTEDIRRLRKKAPCTRLEISMIQRQFLEHEIFAEPIFSGMSGELMSVYSGSHDLSGIMISEYEDNNPPEVANDAECGVEPKVMEEIGIEDSFMHFGHSNDAQLEADGNFQNENQSSDHDVNTQQHVSYGPDVPYILEGETMDITELHVDHKSADAENMFGMDETVNLANPVTTDVDNMFDGETQVLDASQPNGTLCMLPDQHMNTEAANESIAILSNDGATNHFEALDHTVVDTVVGLEPIARGDNIYEESALPDISGAHSNYPISNNNECGFPQTLIEGNPDLDEEKQNVQNEDAVIAASSEVYDQGPSFNNGDEPKPEFVEPLEHNLCNESTSTVAAEDPMWGMDAVRVGTDTHDLVEENRSEFEDVGVANDTDFLNLDDDEVAEDEDDEMPSSEDRQLLENSGWSSRTRAVARYLQNLFDKENVHGRKVLSTDRLLTGKTRKESARMFFETLVLKTKDYIQVEQVNGLGDISIKPRAKLMKSIF